MPDYLLSFYVGEAKEALRRLYMYLNYIYLDFCKAQDTVSLNVFVTILKICRLQMDSEQSWKEGLEDTGEWKMGP